MIDIYVDMEYTFYKIQVGNECYVGSTKNFKNRMTEHKQKSNCLINDKHYNIKVYQSIREVGWDKIDIMIIDKIIYNSKREAEDMETKYMLMFNAKLNSCYPKRSMKKYQLDNKEQISNQRKLFRIENKERLNNVNKEYYDDNRERLIQQQHEYYVNNRQLVSQRSKLKGCCDICGKEMRKDSIRRHKLNCKN